MTTPFPNLLFLSTLLLLATCDMKLTADYPYEFIQLFNDGLYENTPYGAHYTGGVFLTSPEDACSEIAYFNASSVYTRFRMRRRYSKTFALVKMGVNCSNGVKIRNAQRAGADMVILVQNGDLTSTESFQPSDPDGIHIPIIQISEKHGENFTQFIKHSPQNEEYYIPGLAIDFPFDPKSSSVVLDLWMDIAYRKSYEFLTRIAPYISQNKAIRITPHFSVGQNYQQNEHCIAVDRYCGGDPDGIGPLNGRDSLLEILRQKCAWKVDPQIWWNYVQHYKQKCLTKSSHAKPHLEECSLKILGDNIDNINSCISQSFSDPQWDLKDTTNAIFDEENKLYSDYRPPLPPKLYINHKPFAGELDDTESVLQEICNNLDQCQSLVPPGSIPRYPLDYDLFKPLSRGYLVLIALGIFIIFFFWSRYSRREIYKILEKHP